MKEVPHNVLKTLLVNHREQLKKDDSLILHLTTELQEHLDEGKLYIKDFNFCNLELGPILRNIHFGVCEFVNCTFYAMQIYRCDLRNCSFTEVNFQYASKYKSDFPDDFDESSAGMRLNSDYTTLREATWFVKMLETSSEIFNYRYFVERADDVNIVRGSQFFLQFVNPRLLESINYVESTIYWYRWKLHIHIENIEDLEKAFNLIWRKLLANFAVFKVVGPEDFFEIERKSFYGKDSYFLSSAQFTLYLAETEDQSPIIHPDKLLEILQDISKTLSDNNINFGKIPDTDKATVVPGVSLRCEKDIEENYVNAAASGSNFNPVQHNAPYNFLLLEQPERFCAVKHFENFKPDSPEKLINAIKLTLMACLNEYIDLAAFENHSTVINKLEEMASNYLEFDQIFLRDSYKNVRFVSEKIKQIVMALKFVLHIDRRQFLQINFNLTLVKDETLLNLFACVEAKRKEIAPKAKVWARSKGGSPLVFETSINQFMLNEIIQRVRMTMIDNGEGRILGEDARMYLYGPENVEEFFSANYSEETVFIILKELELIKKQDIMGAVGKRIIEALTYVSEAAQHESIKLMIASLRKVVLSILEDDELKFDVKIKKLQQAIADSLKDNRSIYQEEVSKNIERLLWQFISPLYNKRIPVTLSSPVNALRQFNKFKATANESNVPTLKQLTLFCISQSSLFKSFNLPRFVESSFEPDKLKLTLQMRELDESLPQRFNLDLIGIFGEQELKALGSNMLYCFNETLKDPENETMKDIAEGAIGLVEDILKSNQFSIQEKYDNLQTIVFQAAKEAGVSQKDFGSMEDTLEEFKRKASKSKGGCLII